MSALLPIGSVILLKNAVKKLMIIGILQVKPGEDRIYDYLGVPYPEGFLGQDNNFLFDHKDINDIVFTGYTNPEREAFMEIADILRSDPTGEAVRQVGDLIDRLDRES